MERDQKRGTVMVGRATAVIIVAMGAFTAVAACAVNGAGAGASGAAGSATTASVVGIPPSDRSGTPAGCTASGQVTARPGQDPGPVCLSAGQDLRLDTPSSTLQPWQPFTSSNPRVLDCKSTVDTDGAAHATCTAGQRGVAVVSTHTGPFSGDPHGPPQTSWQLTVTVTG
jgi:hypothetical protein